MLAPSSTASNATPTGELGSLTLQEFYANISFGSAAVAAREIDIEVCRERRSVS
jgi:hypothetical protein